MLLNLHKKTWMDGLTLQDYDDHCALNQKTVKASISECKSEDWNITNEWNSDIGIVTNSSNSYFIFVAFDQTKIVSSETTGASEEINPIAMHGEVFS